MSKISDVFGTSPKTVLNKPYFRGTYEELAATPVAGSTGDNLMSLNNVKYSDISGASLSGGRVSLPAGRYRVKATSQIIRGVSNAAQLNTVGKIKDASGNLLVVGNSMMSYYRYDGNTVEVAGDFTLFSTTSVGFEVYSDVADSGLFALSNSDVGETNNIIASMEIWKLDENVETVVINDPDLTLDKPYIHVQDQKTTGTGGGLTAVGWNPRDLNTVLVNEIAGASLSGNAITLPAGSYYIEASAPTTSTSTTTNAVRARVLVDGAEVLLGKNYLATNIYSGPQLEVSGKLELASSGVVTLESSSVTALSSTGLGAPTNIGDYEVYSEVRIWKLDGVKKQAVSQASQSYNGDAYLTGGINGLELSKTGDNQITVTAGDCMDSTNTVALQLTADTALSIGTTINQVYNVFICKETVGGAIVLQADTDVDGANLTGVDYFRWIGFVRNTSSGTIIDFLMEGDFIEFLNPVSETIIKAIASGTYAEFTPGDIVPPTRCFSPMALCDFTTGASFGAIYNDAGTTLRYYIQGSDITTDRALLIGPFAMTGTFIDGAAGLAGNVCLDSIRIKR